MARCLFHYYAKQGLSTEITAVILSSVVPPLTRTFRQLSQDYLHLEPLVINSARGHGHRHSH